MFGLTRLECFAKNWKKSLEMFLIATHSFRAETNLCAICAVIRVREVEAPLHVALDSK
jgi:hypothetical protein